MKRVRYGIFLSDFFLINIPAFLFLSLIPFGVLAYTCLTGFWRWSALPLIVWGFSGGILLLHDYQVRKRALYLKLVRYNGKRNPLAHTLYLRSTFCGLAMQWALCVRLKKNNRRESV